MSLPTANELRNDYICRDVERIVEHLETYRNKAPKDSRFHDSWAAIQEFRVRLQNRIDADELHLMDPFEMKIFLQNLHLVFFKDSIFPSADCVVVIWNTERNPSWKGKTIQEEDSPRHKLYLSTFHNRNALGLIGVILHEMVHMFINTCKRREEKLERTINRSLVGKSGHGYCFHRLAQAVETRAQEIVGGSIILDRHIAIVTEWRATDREPDVTFYHRFFDNGEDVRFWVEAEMVRRLIERGIVKRRENGDLEIVEEALRRQGGT